MLTITLIRSSTSLAYSIFLEFLKTQSYSEFSPLLLPKPQKYGWTDSPQTTKQLEDIHNFKQEGDESLYQALERYNDLLYKCPTYDINSHQKVNIFYKGLSTMNSQFLDSHGPIPEMTPAQALTVIQTMADHSQKWHDKTTSMNTGSSSSNDGLALLVISWTT
ncbi:hypothetical protein Tco_1105577 [Tanacetum coccineum]